MSATPCLSYHATSRGSRCYACGGTRAEHEGRAKPTVSAHPKPSDMAREAYPVDCAIGARAAFTAGAAAERARVAAWLRDGAPFARSVYRAADELEGKVQP